MTSYGKNDTLWGNTGQSLAPMTPYPETPTADYVASPSKQLSNKSKKTNIPTWAKIGIATGVTLATITGVVIIVSIVRRTASKQKENFFTGLFKGSKKNRETDQEDVRKPSKKEEDTFDDFPSALEVHKELSPKKDNTPQTPVHDSVSDESSDNESDGNESDDNESDEESDDGLLDAVQTAAKLSEAQVIESL